MGEPREDKDNGHIPSAVTGCLQFGEDAMSMTRRLGAEAPKKKLDLSKKKKIPIIDGLDLNVHTQTMQVILMLLNVPLISRPTFYQKKNLAHLCPSKTQTTIDSEKKTLTIKTLIPISNASLLFPKSQFSLKPLPN